MTNEEFAEIMALDHELAGVEFKGSGRLADRRLSAQVVKAILGMANRRDGGSVIIGVEDDLGTLNPVGLTSTQVDTWGYDALADQVARYADPGVSFDVEVKSYDGGQYVVIEVEEFNDIPVLCKRAFNDVLRDGACYVRPRRKPETTEIPTQADMRDLLDLATDKVVARYIERAKRLGLLPDSMVIPETGSEDESNPVLGG